MFDKNGNPIKKSKRQSAKEYDKILEDPITFSLDEALQILGPRHEKFN